MRIMRLRKIFNHESPFRRTITEEFTICNDSESVQENILLPLGGFQMYLRVYDSDEYELPYLTNLEIYRRVSDVEALKAELDVPENGYILWIVLPPDRILQPNEIRIIKLVYYDNQNIKDVRYSIFKTPYIRHTKHVDIREDYDTFYIVESPPNCRIKYGLRSGRGVIELHQNITDNNVSVRVPQASGRYRFSFIYYITLSKLELLMWKIFIPLYVLFSMIILSCSFQWIQIEYLLEPAINSISIVFGGVSIALLAILHGDIMSRIKSILWMTLILNIIATLITL